jgi:citrate lyase gamma subunit
VLGAEQRADAQRALDLLLRQRADFRIGIGQAALAEQLAAVQAARGRVDLQARAVQNLLDRAQLGVHLALGVEVVVRMLGVPGHEVVVVERGALDQALLGRLGEQLRHLERVDFRQHRAPERIAQRVAHTPERH